MQTVSLSLMRPPGNPPAPPASPPEPDGPGFADLFGSDALPTAPQDTAAADPAPPVLPVEASADQALAQEGLVPPLSAGAAPPAPLPAAVEPGQAADASGPAGLTRPGATAAARPASGAPEPDGETAGPAAQAATTPQALLARIAAPPALAQIAAEPAEDPDAPEEAPGNAASPAAATRAGGTGALVIRHAASVPPHWTVQAAPSPDPIPAGITQGEAPLEDAPGDGAATLPAGPSPALPTAVPQAAAQPLQTILPVGPGGPTPPAAPPPPPGSAPPALPSSLPGDIAAIVSARPDGPVELRLSPEELGRLHLRLVSEGDMLRVTILVERPETLDLLRRNADALIHEIRVAGFAGGSFTFAGWGGSLSGGNPEGRPSGLVRPDLPDSSFHHPAVAETGPRALSATGLDLRL